MKACPKCHGTTGFIRKTLVTGYEETDVSWNGRVYSSPNASKVMYHNLKTGICHDCGKEVEVCPERRK